MWTVADAVVFLGGFGARRIIGARFPLADVRGSMFAGATVFAGANVVAGEVVEGFVGFAAAAGEGFFGRAIGNQAIAAVADQILAAGLLEGFADFEIVLRLEELQQGPLQPAVAEVLGDVDRLAW